TARRTPGSWRPPSRAGAPPRARRRAGRARRPGSRSGAGAPAAPVASRLRVEAARRPFEPRAARAGGTRRDCGRSSALDSAGVAADQLALREEVEGEDRCDRDSDTGEDQVPLLAVVAGVRIEGDGQRLDAAADEEDQRDEELVP